MLSASRLPFPAPPAGTSRKSVPVPGVPAGFREDSGAADHVVRPGRNARNRSAVRPAPSDCHPLGPNLELGASSLRMGSLAIDDAVRDEAIQAWRHSGFPAGFRHRFRVQKRVLAVFEDTGVPGPRLEKLPGLGEALGSLAEEGAGVLRAVKRDLVAMTWWSGPWTSGSWDAWTLGCSPRTGRGRSRGSSPTGDRQPCLAGRNTQLSHASWRVIRARTTAVSSP